MPTMKHQLARLLLELSYREGSFTLASGRHSDYYFDCRQTALHPKGAWLIGNIFNDLLEETHIVAIGGMTLGADPIISATSVISYERKHPLAGLIVRKESKGHGTQQYVEGLANVKPGDPIAMLEDVVTTGASLLKAVERVQAEQLEVKILCTILDRDEGGREVLEKAGFSLLSIFTRASLLKYGKQV